MVALLAALAVLAPAPGAGAAIYWGSSMTIGAARLDGGGIDPYYFQWSQHAKGPYDELVATDTDLYWRGSTGIMRLNLDGVAAPTPVVTGINALGSAGGIAVGAGFAYWTSPESDSIGRVALDGSGRNDAFITLSRFSRPCAVAVRGGYIYWRIWSGIGRARLDGTDVEESFISTSGGCALAVDDSHIYWPAVEGGVGRATIGGDAVEPRFVDIPGHTLSLAVQGGVVYWVEQPPGAYATIGRAVPGHPPDPGWIQTGGGSDLRGLAVDSRSEPAPRPRPSAPAEFGRIRHNAGRGIATIEILTRGSGQLALSAPAIGWRIVKGPDPALSPGLSRWRLKLWPGKQGEESTRVKRQLARRGRAPLALSVSYTETGQLPGLATKKMALRKKPARLTKRSVGHHR